MFKQSLLLASISVALTAHTTVLANTDPFLESDGRLVFETESEQAQSDWSVDSDVFGFTGQGYLVWEGPNFLNSPDDESTISYHVRITTPGNYQLRLRSRNTIGLDATDNNDSWVRFPTGENIDGEHSLEKGEDGNRWTKAFMGQVEQWTWDTFTVGDDNQPIRQFLDAGDHVIDIAGRSTGHAIDRISLHLYEEETFDAELFATLNQSPRASEILESHHAFTGNVCVAQELTLSADLALQVTDTGTVVTGETIAINNTSTAALLQFVLPNTIASNAENSTAILSLAGIDSLTGLTVYLGSHNDWNEQTALQNLPNASVQLGELNATNQQGEIQTISLDRSMLTDDTVTLVLQTRSVSDHQIFGIVTGAEPRLNFTLSTDACNSYQNARANTPFLGEDQTQTDTGTETSTESEGEIQFETEFKPVPVIETENVSDIETDSTDENARETPEDNDTETSGSSGGGAFSTLFVTILTFLGIFRIRKKRSDCFLLK